MSVQLYSEVPGETVWVVLQRGHSARYETRCDAGKYNGCENVVHIAVLPARGFGQADEGTSRPAVGVQVGIFRHMAAGMGVNDLDPSS